MTPCSSVCRHRISTATLVCGLVVACVIGAGRVSAQLGPIPGRSVNMVSGTEWPDGDPFLQRQNEGSIAVSTRNPLHILGGGNDYRTVDIPGLPDGSMSGDAWNGVFWSRDGGHRWKSTLLPGYPQDMSAEGLASPIHGLQAGADPVIRAGANGMMFYIGIAFNRDAITQNASVSMAGGGKTGKVFVARFIDDNARETGNPFRYLETLIVDNGSDGRFLDKPWLAVDKPRPGGGSCSIPASGDIGPQTFPSGNVYVAYTTFVGKSDTNIRTKVMFARSADCGRSWQTQKLSEGYPVNQGAVIAIEPQSGAVYVAWRRFRSDKGDPDGFMIAKSVDGGRSFTKASDIVTFTPYTLTSGTVVSRIFEQGTSIASFRTTGFPAMTVDSNGVVYVAWAERGIGPFAGARIMMRRSADGLTWSETAFPVEKTNEPGHQFMPTLVFHAGRVSLSYYNLVEDHTLGFLDPKDASYVERREPAGDLAEAAPVLEKVFNDFVADFAPEGLGALKRRHTIDLWLADGPPAPPSTPMTMEPTRVSQYVYGDDPFSDQIIQYQYNPPNYPLFACQGELINCKAFFGDYIDLAGSPALVPMGGGVWDFNTQPSTSRVLHAIWTDNRDVRPPADGISWHLYTPPNSPFSERNPVSLFDPTKMRETCGFLADGTQRAGMRNQNLYTARITEGLVAGSPQNSKPLGLTTIDGNTVLLQRAFVVFAQNTTGELKTFRMTIANQPPDAPAPGRASFLQFPTTGFPDPLTELFVRVPAKSTATRTVFVTSGVENASVTVLVEEFTALPGDGGVPVPPSADGLTATVVLNPDITNPDITNPDITNPDITNPDITNAEVYNPDITNPDITNPDITNPDITNPDITNPDITNPDITNPDITNVQIFNPDITNPDITNPDITNPDITNPDITNPDITNPDITNPDITNGTVAEATWTIKDTGNTTGGYRVKLLVNGSVPADFKTQLIIHRGHSTPVAVDCELAVQRQPILVANIPDPEFTSILSPDITNPDITNPDITNATLHVGPGDDWAQITLRIVDTLPGVGPTPEEFLTTTVTPVVVAQAVNTEDAVAGSTEPPVSVPPQKRVAFLVPPAGGQADAPLSPAVQVQVRDERSQPVEGATVTLSIFSGPEGAELGGNQAVTDAFGIAQFPNLTVSPDGVYTLLASVDGEQPPDPAVSAPFIIATACDLDAEPVILHSTVDAPSSSDIVKSRIANFDGDPYPDLAVLHLNGTLTKMAGDGLGGFERRLRITLAPGTEGSPSDLAVADFNNDGLDDVVVSFPTEDLLAIVSSDANSPEEYFDGGTRTQAFGVPGGPTALAAGRFRTFADPGDEQFDLAVAATTDNTIWLLEGDGDGGLANQGSFADLFAPVALAAGDMDGDGLDDLAVATRGNGDNVGPAASVLLSILFYDDEVPTVPGGSAPAGVNPSGVTIADFNIDGDPDVAVVSAGLVIAGDDVNIPGDVRVLHGDGAGRVTPADDDAGTVVVLPGRPTAVAAADLDADGFADLAIANLSNLLVSAHEESGGYAAPVTFTAGNTPVHVAAGDVNGDSLADVVIANREADDSGNSTVSVFLTRCGTTSTDLAVAVDDAPDPVDAGETITYTTVVSNNGPLIATGVSLTQTVGGAVVSASSTVGSCTSGSPVTCDIGDLGVGMSATVTIEVTAPGAGPVGSRATVRGEQTDLSPANNTETESTELVAEPRNFVVTNTNDSGPGSLRAAMEAANANAGFLDTITFAILQDAPHIIATQSPLPAITDAVHIDAMPAGNCALAPPAIEVDGTSGGPETHGFEVMAGPSMIRGLSITGFSGAAIRLVAGGNSVQCNHLGVRPDGTTAASNNLGVDIASDNNVVDGNVISANRQSGVLIVGGGGFNTLIRNRIGVNRAGDTALGNTTGVEIGNSPGNQLGGPGGLGNVISGNGANGLNIIGANTVNTAAYDNLIGVAADGVARLANGAHGVLIDAAVNTILGEPGNGNVISGNVTHGVLVVSGATGTRIVGNRIGTDRSGTAAVPNSVEGIRLDTAASTLIGGLQAGAGNLISGNGSIGLAIGGSNDTDVQGNRIGTDVTGMLPLANGAQGINIGGPSQNNRIGGAAPGAGNIISGNNFAGVLVQGGPNNAVRGNFIGTNVLGTAAIPNNGQGIVIASAGAIIGGGLPGEGNLISGNASTGIFAIPAAPGAVIRGNRIGTNADGDAALPNANDGIGLQSANNVVGGTAAGDRNLISGNRGNGVHVFAEIPATATGNVIAGNLIGTDVTGTVAIGNGTRNEFGDLIGAGVRLAGPGNTVGGLAAGSRNVMSGNGTGVSVEGAAAAGNIVQGNYIGTNAAGDASLFNRFGMFVSGAPDTLIGSAQASGRNVISGNRVEGIAITGEASAGTQVLGNLIGTDAGGTASLGNTLHGISVRFGAVVTIGGAAAGAGNVVAGNSGGISIETSGNTILGNRIGIGESGENLGNGGTGISLSLASNNRIGGTESGEANVIAYNLGDGISVSGGSGNALVMNAIFSNGDNPGEDLGIDLDGDGLTPNDVGDPDEGANDLQNFPELTAASVSGGSVNVQGSLDTAEAGAPFRVDYYVSDVCDPSGHGQGQTWFAAQNVFTDDGGMAILDLNASGVPVAAGQFVTAVATSPGGSTSEFSACVAVEISSIPADVTVAPVGAPQMFITDQDFNGERTVDVTVTAETALSVTSMRLNDLDLTSGAVVTARIYDATGNLIAFAATVLSSGIDQQVEIPISATLISGARYRVGFHVNPDITDGATALMFDPRETTGFPYQAEPLGRLQVESAQFNGEPHFAVPLMRVQ